VVTPQPRASYPHEMPEKESPTDPPPSQPFLHLSDRGALRALYSATPRLPASSASATGGPAVLPTFIARKFHRRNLHYVVLPGWQSRGCQYAALCHATICSSRERYDRIGDDFGMNEHHHNSAQTGHRERRRRSCFSPRSSLGGYKSRNSRFYFTFK